MLKIIDIRNYFILAIILIIAHFIPFERSSLAPDDYSLSNNINGLNYFLLYPDRPILYFFLDYIYSFVDQTNYYFFILIILNFLNIIIVYFLYSIFFDKNISFLLSVIYLLLFFKLEIYHNSIMIHISLVSSLYLLCLYFLTKFFINEKKLFYIISILLYLISIFWYEIGFFIPYILIFCKLPNSNLHFKRKFYLLTPIILVSLIYIILRLTNNFGYTTSETSYTINLSFINGIIDIFNHHIGRYAFKNIIYGFYQFLNIQIIYLLLIVVLNFIIILYFIKYININKIFNKNILFFSLLFLFSIFPLILNGEAAGRNLIISSISISLFIYLIIQKFKFFNKYIYISLLVLGLIISQGNSWSQVVASRIQNSIFITLDYYKNEIEQSNYLIFNPFSLTQNIDFSFVNNNYNLINTYYGAQVWETWGISGYLIREKYNLQNPLIITRNNPELENDKYKISKINNIIKKKISSQNIVIPNKNIFILDFNKIYPNGFNDGKN